MYGSDLSTVISSSSLQLVRTKGRSFHDTLNYIDSTGTLSLQGDATFSGGNIGIGTGANPVAAIVLNGTLNLWCLFGNRFADLDLSLIRGWTEATLLLWGT